MTYRAAARTFHPNGKDEAIAVGRVMATVNAHWDGSSLIVVYKAETGRELHYTYSLNANPMQLIVDVEFVEQGGGDTGDEVRAGAIVGEAEARTQDLGGHGRGCRLPVRGGDGGRSGGEAGSEPVDRPGIELRQELARDGHPRAGPDEPREGGHAARGGCLGGEEHVPERMRTVRSLVRVKSPAP